MGLVVNVKEGQIGLNFVVQKWDFEICQGRAKTVQKCLTSQMRGLAWIYHLRSNSGSNGPIAKESHRFLVAGPFKFLQRFRCLIQAMKKLRYSLLLPALHLFLSALLIYPQQSKTWPYLKNTPPVDEPEPLKPEQEGFGPMPCYEYRPSVADRFAFFVQFPVGLPLGLDGSFRACNHGLIALLFRKLRMGAKTGTIFLDLLLACMIAGQWWLIGWKIDSLHKANRSAWLWVVPVAVISLSGCLMVPAGLGARNWLDLVAALAAIFAFLTWIFLLVAGLIVGIKKFFQERVIARAA